MENTKELNLALLEKKQELEGITRKEKKLKKISIEPMVPGWNASCHDDKQYLKQIYSTHCRGHDDELMEHRPTMALIVSPWRIFHYLVRPRPSAGSFA
jgi:hypothetical protein